MLVISSFLVNVIKNGDEFDSGEVLGRQCHQEQQLLVCIDSNLLQEEVYHLYVFGKGCLERVYLASLLVASAGYVVALPGLARQPGGVSVQSMG